MNSRFAPPGASGAARAPLSGAAAPVLPSRCAAAAATPAALATARLQGRSKPAQGATTAGATLLAARGTTKRLEPGDVRPMTCANVPACLYNKMGHEEAEFVREGECEVQKGSSPSCNRTLTCLLPPHFSICHGAGDAGPCAGRAACCASRETATPAQRRASCCFCMLHPRILSRAR
jgi:hypothetical protein